MNNVKDMAQTTFYIPRDLFRAFKVLAAENDRSMANIICELLTRVVAGEITLNTPTAPTRKS